MAQNLTTIDDLEKHYGAAKNKSLEENWVTMSNALARSKQCLSLSEKRLVMCAISQLDSKKNLQNKGDFPYIKIIAADYAETFSLDINTAYDQLQSATKNLYERSIKFFKPSHIRKDKTLETVHMRWLSSISYKKTEGWVQLRFVPELANHLTGLQGVFTTYQLNQATALRSVYSWRLLELLTTFEATGWAEYSIEDFITSMEVPPSLKLFGQMKRRILDVAVKELINKDNWLIKYDLIKAGRKVKAIRFVFKRDPQGRLF